MLRCCSQHPKRTLTHFSDAPAGRTLIILCGFLLPAFVWMPSCENRFLIRRQVSLPWAGQHFDVLDPDTTQPVMECREQRSSWLRRIAQWLDWSAGMPGPVECSTPEGKVVLKIRKHFSLMSHCLSFENAYGCVLGKRSGRAMHPTVR
jgi:hypothetical protein